MLFLFHSFPFQSLKFSWDFTAFFWPFIFLAPCQLRGSVFLFLSGLFTVICFSFYLGRQIVWLWSLLIIVHTLYVQFNHQTIEYWSLIFLKTHTHACARTNSHKQPLCVFFPWAWGKLYSCDIIIAHKFMCAIQFSNHVILISDLFTLYIYIYI